MWVSAAFGHVRDPGTGRRMIVGTFRDVTDEHHASRRESALAALGMRLTEAAGLEEALAGALAELKELWRARRVLAAVFTGEQPRLTGTDGGLSWDALPAGQRAALTEQRGRPPLTPTAARSGAGITLGRPDGPLVLWLDLGERRPFIGHDRLLSTDPPASLPHRFPRTAVTVGAYGRAPWGRARPRAMGPYPAARR
jgi:hypothetical protein